MNRERINEKYLELHNALGNPKKYTALQRQQHDQIWADCNTELRERKDTLEHKHTLSPEERIELMDLTIGGM